MLARFLLLRLDVTADVFDEVGNFDLRVRHVSYVAVFLVKRRTPFVGPKDIIRRVFIAGHCHSVTTLDKSVGRLQRDIPPNDLSASEGTTVCGLSRTNHPGDDVVCDKKPLGRRDWRLCLLSRFGWVLRGNS
jgi:hypothetical protein